MAVVLNELRRGFYLDSVALMRIARAVAALPGVEEAGLMIATPANKQILREAGILGESGGRAGPGDLVIALRAKDAAAADAAMAEAQRLLDRPRHAAVASGAAWRPHTLRGAVQQMPDANLALISVPGDFAAAEARKALRRGLNAMIFSDNVPVRDEIDLKCEGRDLGLLVMGPDCGTAIIGGVPLGFANSVPRGDIGIVGASGTGIQEVSCLIANAGRGISHAIGTGGRDLSADVGGITTLMAIDLLDLDPATAHVVVISKPPAPEVAAAVLARIGRSRKPFTVCLIGDVPGRMLPGNAGAAATLSEAAEAALGCALPRLEVPAPKLGARGKAIRGLFCGGTLCSEAQVVLRSAGLAVASNAPIPGAARLGSDPGGHRLIDLGDDAFTHGRPHPMIEPALRDAPLREALTDETVGVVLLDVMLGWGSHADPAGELVRIVGGRPSRAPLVIASVTGTDADPQVRSAQVRGLADAGIIVAPSNAAAAALAAQCVR
jgi:succinyl-CoA synthetase alpha subunit